LHTLQFIPFTLTEEHRKEKETESSHQPVEEKQEESGGKIKLFFFPF
jgi:hypothetical protein